MKLLLRLLILFPTLCHSHLTLAADFDEVTRDGIAFILIPTGQFVMGSNDGDRALLQQQGVWTRFNECERPAKTVTISKPFLISKYEITQKQWQEVMGKNPSAFKGDALPVESVSWDDVQEFITKLREKANGKYRLPTEAEWEYCARSGSANAYGPGQNHELVTTNNLPEYAWFRGNAESKTHEIGQKKPNAWGLYDLHGNVWEWCQDWYAADYYAQAPLTDPLNNAASTERVLRGGSWFLDWPHLRAANRSGGLPTFRSPYVGFRLVREL
jgi:formylglycine-generating enzyme required for sulfatase activity